MMNTDYKIEAIKVLLNEDCILTRYYPLIPYKDILVENLNKMGCYKKSVCKNDEEIQSFRELYQLPGVKSTRAILYYKAGYCTLVDIANAPSESIIAKTENVIREGNFDLKVPLLKEVKTHIAVARAFTDVLID